MELGQLEAFVEAQRRGSITRAAAALDLTQPTLTARLRGLEIELGAQLLVRGRRGVSLTPAGRRFLPRAQAALDAVRRGVAEMKAAREGRGGRLALGLATDLALYIAPAALARFARAHPDVEISVRSGRSHAVAEALRADEIEIGIVSQLVALPELASRPLFEEPVPVVVARAHPLAHRGRVDIEELARAGLVMRDPSAYLYAITVAFFAEAGTAPRILMELNNTEACKRVVLAGLGAALLPQMAIHEETKRGELVVLRVEGRPAARRTIHLLHRGGEELSTTANALLKALPRAS
ncbi:MAG TPA: LysR family transcriptional regulator [Candidatus Limnocylindria bacterium]|jgi:DNA-binding transcriptional LysR family regulator|nr:LysR family transcriptional regulator [Candidatus Limnocylindria bacterium]